MSAPATSPPPKMMPVFTRCCLRHGALLSRRHVSPYDASRRSRHAFYRCLHSVAALSPPFDTIITAMPPSCRHRFAFYALPFFAIILPRMKRTDMKRTWRREQHRAIKRTEKAMLVEARWRMRGGVRVQRADAQRAARARYAAAPAYAARACEHGSFNADIYYGDALCATSDTMFFRPARPSPPLAPHL